MPTSSYLVTPTVIEHMVALNPHSILDVGSGNGRYAGVWRGLFEGVRLISVEAWGPYVTQFGLRNLYDEVHMLNVLDADDAFLNQCDVVWLGDVIEHIEKDAAIALLGRIHKPVVISTPEHFFYNGDNLPPTEDHVSHWTLEDFQATGRVTREDVVFAGLIVTLGPS